MVMFLLRRQFIAPDRTGLDYIRIRNQLFVTAKNVVVSLDGAGCIVIAIACLSTSNDCRDST